MPLYTRNASASEETSARFQVLTSRRMLITWVVSFDAKNLNRLVPRSTATESVTLVQYGSILNAFYALRLLFFCLRVLARNYCVFDTLAWGAKVVLGTCTLPDIQGDCSCASPRRRRVSRPCDGKRASTPD